MRTDWKLRFIEFLYWVGFATLGVVVVSLLLGLVIGGSLVAGKYAMFVFGAIIFGVGILAVQPDSPGPDVGARRGGDGMTGGSSGMRSRLSPDISVEGEHEHRLETRIQELPPLRDGALRYEKRIGRPTKLVVTGLLVLLVSATLEFAFGIQV